VYSLNKFKKNKSEMFDPASYLLSWRQLPVVFFLFSCHWSRFFVFGKIINLRSKARLSVAVSSLLSSPFVLPVTSIKLD